MKPRPIGFTLLAIFFGLAAVAGAGNAAIILAHEGSFFSPALGLLVLAYALAAGFTSIGLWRVRAWAITSMRLWMLVCGGLMLWLALGPFPSLGTSTSEIVAFTGLIIGLFYLLQRYVTRTLRPAA